MFHFKNFIVFLLISNTVLFSNDLQDVKTFEASFTQTIINPSGNEVKYTGLLHIQEPDKIKWQYKDPIEKLVYVKKNSVTIIEPELEQAIITKIDQEINILNLLKNAKKTSDNNYLSLFNNVEYSLTIENKKLTKIAYKDEIENNVIITFTNVQQNHSIAKDIFLFTIPFEFDIIKK